MRAITNDTTVTIDLIKSVHDVGELTKLALRLGLSAVVEDATDDEHGAHVRVRLILPERVFLESTLTALTLVQAYTRGQSVEETLDVVRRDLEKRHAPLNEPIQEVMAIGGGTDYESGTGAKSD